MPKRTSLLQVIPWDAGLNTSKDPAIIPKNALTIADNVLFDTKGSRQKREGAAHFDSSTTTSNRSVIGGIDWWHDISNVKTQKIVTVRTSSSSTTIELHSTDGTVQAITNYGASALAVSVERVSLEAINNMVVIGFSGVTTPKKVYYRAAAIPEVSTVTTIADSAGSLGGKYFDIYDDVGPVRVWIDVDNGSMAPSTPMGGRLLEVNITSGDSANNVAAAVNSAVDADSKFASSVNNNIVTITSSTNGARTDISAGTSGFTVAVTTQGANVGYEYSDLGGSPQNFSICRQHLGRLWTDDKSNRDRLHYSQTGNAEIWGGTGDSGAFDVRPYDNDPVGLTAIFPTFKGDLFVAKYARLYRLAGLFPEEISIKTVTSGLGCVSHNSIVQVDEEDMLFESARGFHSLITTVNFGDYSSKYLSADVQASFNTFSKSRQKFTYAAYIPTLNSVAFGLSEGEDTANNDIWLYNFTQKMDGSGPIGWYRWPNLSCQCLFVANLNNEPVLMAGTNNNRLVRFQTGVYRDVFDSVNNAIQFRAKTGYVAPDDNLYSVKGFKKIIIYFRPKGPYSFTATFKIDNYADQQVNISTSNSFALLGSTFFLGTSTLGSNPVLAAYAFPVDGIGRGFTLQLDQAGINQEVEVYGFGIEFEMHGDAQETIGQ